MPRPAAEPWWHARAGWLVALAIALGTGWLNDRAKQTETQTRQSIMPDRRDREIDQMLSRIAALEARCRGQ
jgi:hypothetical protein